jgi:hypothetical protein
MKPGKLRSHRNCPCMLPEKYSIRARAPAAYALAALAVEDLREILRLLAHLASRLPDSTSPFHKIL